MSRFPLRRWPFGPIMSCLLLAASGCQNHVAPVSGRITLNGQPISGAVVTFQPRGSKVSPQPAGTGSVGRTDGQGRYSLRLIDPDQPGAIVGEHSVTISTATGGTDETPATGKPMPKAWRDGSKRFKVPPAGTSDANFEINARGSR
jgi:hypothetical protein